LPLGRVGAWCSIGSSYVVELLGSCGFDWICIDLQHGFAAVADLLPMLQAASITHTPVVVRVPRLDAGLIGRALDAGAAGVIIPMVNSAAEARDAVRACRYAPDGARSWGPARLLLADPAYSAQRANARIQCVVMVETLEAVRNLDEIVQVDGVDAIFVGPSDLAVDMDLPPRRGQTSGDHADVLAAIARTCQKSGMPAGIFCGTFRAVPRFEEMGYTILAATTDAALLRAAASEGVQGLRAPDEASLPGSHTAEESETR
jgi:4-hydroxy-2-oxoheptanedioate aldolase